MKFLKFLVMAVSLILAANASGGASSSVPVEITIDPDNGWFYAQGSMGTARWSDNDVELIGCGVKKFSGYEWGFCQARDATDYYVSCRTEDPQILEALSVINDTSFIQFNWEPGVDPDTGDPIYESGTCTRIGVSSQSFYITGDKGKYK